jgi:hypothetical protein
MSYDEQLAARIPKVLALVNDDPPHRGVLHPCLHEPALSDACHNHGP